MSKKFYYISNLSIIIIGVIGSIALDYTHLEPRTYLLRTIANGFLFFAGTSLFFTLQAILCLINKKQLLASLFFVLMVLALFLTFLSFIMLPYYQDMAIYHSDKNANEKLVFQYFETGVTGNPNSRTITTKNNDLPIRKIEIINQKSLPDSLKYLEGLTEKHFPKLLKINGCTYYFEKYNSR